jgi:flagellar biosynthetic protein FlhB
LYAAVAGILAYLYRQKVEERVRRDRQAKEREKKVEQSARRVDGRGPNGTMGIARMHGFGGGM